MASTPNSNTEDLLLVILVKIGGTALAETIQVQELDIKHEINKISYADILLVGADSVAEASFPTLDAATFNPGAKVEIQAGYLNGSTAVIFEGIIVKLGLEIGEDSLVRSRILCKHAAVQMTFNRVEAMFASKTDSQIMQAVFSSYSSVTASVTSTSATQEFVFQKNCTDWDFVLARAAANGFVVTMDDTKLSVAKPSFSGSSVLSIPLSEASVYSLEAYLNAEKKPPSVEISAWDSKSQALIKATSTNPTLNDQGNIKPATLSSSLSQTKLAYTTLTPQAKEDLQAIADSLLLQYQMSSLTGGITFIGNAAPKTGKIIELSGIGAKFNGKAYISAVTHHISDGLWKTTISFGLDSKRVYELPDFSGPAALGQMAGINGLQIGTVTKISSDPQSFFRIEVTIPSATGTSKVWARFAGFYATSGAGAFFFPEVGDEVVLGFLDADPRYPIILGSLYSGSRSSPVTPADDNNYIKSLTTKSKLVVEFDDQNKVITVKTPGGNSIVISDKDKSIKVEDQNNNKLTLNSSGITLDSGKDVTIKASGDISLTATGKVNIKATSDTTIKGMNVTAQADIGLTVKGSATAELSASGQTTVKGGIVMIN
jgi:Rhs element Vgr protein